jgi:hypothetical protein
MAFLCSPSWNNVYIFILIYQCNKLENLVCIKPETFVLQGHRLPSLDVCCPPLQDRVVVTSSKATCPITLRGLEVLGNKYQVTKRNISEESRTASKSWKLITTNPIA